MLKINKYKSRRNRVSSVTRHLSSRINDLTNFRPSSHLVYYFKPVAIGGIIV